jgi:hypothetical protein
VLLALLATAVLLAADSLYADQAAAEQGVIGDALEGLGTGIAFSRGAVGSRRYAWCFSCHREDLLSVIAINNRVRGVMQELCECEFAPVPSTNDKA